jgi:DNA polymerase III epsilon subunit family exonuclease
MGMDALVFTLFAVAVVGLIWLVFAIRAFYREKTPETKVFFRGLSILPEQFIVLDLETTGLNPDKHEIIEIGAIKVNRDSTHHSTFQTLIKPDKKIPRNITEITGITQEMADVEGMALKPPMSELLGDLRLVAYNAEFDMGFLHAAAARCGFEIKNPVSCALKMARRAWPGYKSYRLGDVAKAGGLSTAGAHRALHDCRVTMRVYSAAASKLRSVG